MNGRTIAIGDIHGCAVALDRMLELIKPTQADTLVTLGDYVDRGPDSKGVIDRLIKLSRETRLIALMGNHEEMMLSVVRDREEPYRWLQYGGVDTLDSYGFGGDLSVIPEEHLAFFDSLMDFFETDTHIFLHANYNPLLPLGDQPTDLLRWVKLSEYLPEPHVSGKKVILGHTHDRGGEVFWLDHLICLDTYCYGGGWLTGFDVDTETIWQVDINGNVRA